MPNFKNFSGNTQKFLDTFFTFLENKKFSGTWLIYHNDSIFEGNCGIANPSVKLAPTLLSPFQIASTGKTFLGILASMLIEDSILNIKDTFGKYFPNSKYKHIVLKNMLTHQSGIVEYHQIIEKHTKKYDSLISDETVMNIIEKDSNKNYFEQGKEFDYCNTNYFLLAKVMEKIMKKSFSQLIYDSIIKPIGMDSTHFYNPNKRKLKDYFVQGLYYEKKAYDEYLINAVFGDKGIYSNPKDLLKLYIALRDNKILKIHSKVQMWYPWRPYRHYGQYAYGYGWRMTKINTTQWYFHNGWWKGYRSHYWLCPDKNICFIILSNRAGTGIVDCKSMALKLQGELIFIPKKIEKNAE